MAGVLVRAARVAGAQWRRFWRGGLAALVAAAGLGLLTLGPTGLAVTWRDYSEQQAVARARQAHHVGEPVQDDQVVFIVHEVRCGAADRGGSVNGQLCEVTIGAHNDGPEEIRVPARAQMLHVSEGARHPPAATGSTKFGHLAPREAATAVIRFDIPRHVTVTHVEVRAFTYSRGVPVSIDTPYLLVTPE